MAVGSRPRHYGIVFLGKFILHTLIATVGSMILEIVIRIPFGGPVWSSPSGWWPGLILGITIGLVARDTSACWVWISGLVWIAYGTQVASLLFGASLDSWVTHTKHSFFPTTLRECSSGECLGVFFFTMRALNTIVYSVGALLGILLRKAQDRSGRPMPDARN
jgi:hypothetical protein